MAEDWQDKNVTEWNSSMACLMRLDRLLTDANDLKRLCFFNGYNTNALIQYRYTIATVFNEICPKMEKKEYDKVVNISKLYDRYKIVGHKRDQYGNVTVIINKDHFEKFYRLTISIENYLRKIADKRGMLITNKEFDMW